MGHFFHGAMIPINCSCLGMRFSEVFFGCIGNCGLTLTIPYLKAIRMGNMMMGMISEPFGNVVTTSIKTRGNYGYFMENHRLWTPPNRQAKGQAFRQNLPRNAPGYCLTSCWAQKQNRTVQANKLEKKSCSTNSLHSCDDRNLGGPSV